MYNTIHQFYFLQDQGMRQSVYHCIAHAFIESAKFFLANITAI